MATKKKLLQAAAGSAGGEALNVEDVFSTYLYDGTSAEHTITNGIDLAGEGGMIWGKIRSATDQHWLVDSERGTGSNNNYKYLMSNLTNGELDFASRSVSSFNSDGFTLQNGTDSQFNESGQDYASWTFRKAPKFFTCVTWTGDGTDARQISHSLGSAPGCIIVKNTSSSNTEWMVYHRSLSDDLPNHSLSLVLNQTYQQMSWKAFGEHSTQTSSVFTLGTSSPNEFFVNQSGQTYVAYLFAHNDDDGEFGPDGDADIIKCGSYTSSNPTNRPEVDLGFEPQWLLIKNATASSNWMLVDNMRGLPVNGGDQTLAADSNAAESGIIGEPNAVALTPTGFKLTGGVTASNAGTGNTHIYIAIRRGTKVPESGTEVFAIDAVNSSEPYFTSGFPIDMAFYKSTSGSSGYVSSRLTGLTEGELDTTAAFGSATAVGYDKMTGFVDAAGNPGANYYAWMWKRAPGYFDAVAYTGDSTAQRAISHNLGVAPEMIWVKNRDQSGYNWIVGMGDPVGWDYYLSLNGSSSRGYSNIYFGNTNTAPTDSQFYVGRSAGWDDTNRDTYTYIAYLFASLPGISKVGSYTGTGATLNINCGFTSGARFVLLKKTSGTGHWIVFDTARGIVSGNDPFLQINRTSAEVTAYDVVDPYSSGFTLTSDPTYGLNTSGASYIFYAIA